MSAPPIRHLEPVGLGRTHRLKPEPVPVYKRRKVAGKFALVVLLSLSVITGSLAGLTLVFSVDLPRSTISSDTAPPPRPTSTIPRAE